MVVVCSVNFTSHLLLTRPLSCRQLMQSIAYFPSDVFKILRDPTSTVDLYVPRTDITFDDFRLRDSELLKQGGAMLKKQWDSSRKGGVLQGLGWDSFFKAVLTFCT